MKSTRLLAVGVIAGSLLSPSAALARALNVMQIEAPRSLAFTMNWQADQRHTLTRPELPGLASRPRLAR
ncbi:hypothetical protein PY650_21445 [Rhizobium calliandrae]|uniref:Uncharacterized protein n=1 Tax=Rhizobium calliandrae TaxID=1312182 RepID=A0ABT7KHP9_9HYPH|nr:hypothetical protein [Rhizobium calliandrae]MDL2408164.1 hypothetical protein [Rhizobium calliandrae]